MARAIGFSIGGFGAGYCQPRPQESHLSALMRMGLDYNKAGAVLDAMSAAGVLRAIPGRKPFEPEARVAQRILAEVGGISCAVMNPRRR